MPHTILSSKDKEVAIGFDHPFCIVGERINPTGPKQLAAELVDGDFSRVEADAISQIDAGAHILDVNTGVPMADEPTLMVRAVKLVQPLTHATVSVDSFMPEALKAGLESNHC